MIYPFLLPQRPQSVAKVYFKLFLGALGGELFLFFYRKGRQETQSLF
jgi:hypothetical protein